MTNRDANGKRVEVGAWVFFKCDVEQYGVVVKTEGNRVIVRNDDPRTGETRTYRLLASDVEVQ